MKILIIGASGYLGTYLAEYLYENKHDIVVSSRNADRARQLLGQRYGYFEWDGRDAARLASLLEEMDAVINLAGYTIGLGRWTVKRKDRFYHSRIDTGKVVAAAFGLCRKKPQVLMQASASGYYGTKAISPAGEQRPEGEGFLARVCVDWESSVRSVEDMGTRVIYLRTGPVLGPHSPFLEGMLLSFRMGMGVVPGNGRQMVPWVHFQDVIGGIRFLLEHPSATGPFNFTAPEPCTMRRVVKAIGKIRRQPSWITIPDVALKIVLGEMALETVLTSQDVLPEALMQAGYSFAFRDIDTAVANLIKKRS